jgi:hypothetical protein
MRKREIVDSMSVNVSLLILKEIGRKMCNVDRKMRYMVPCADISALEGCS